MEPRHAERRKEKAIALAPEKYAKGESRKGGGVIQGLFTSNRN
jgi:hypothetical protein